MFRIEWHNRHYLIRKQNVITTKLRLILKYLIIGIIVAVAILLSIPSKTETYIALEDESLTEAVREQLEAFESHTCSDYLPEIQKYDWDVATVLRIMHAESGCNPNAVNDNPSTGDYSIGLMQINIIGGMRDTRPSEEVLKIPSENIKFAYELYNSTRGFNHWTTF